MRHADIARHGLFELGQLRAEAELRGSQYADDRFDVVFGYVGA